MERNLLDDGDNCYMVYGFSGDGDVVLSGPVDWDVFRRGLIMLFWGLWLEATIIATIAMLDASLVALDVAHELLCGRIGGAEKSPSFFC